MNHSQASLNSSSAKLKMIVSMVIFGSIGFFSERSNLQSVELVFVRCVCATLFLSACWMLTGKYKEEKWSKRDVIQTLICGVFLVLNWVFLFKAFEQTSVTVAISIYHLAPVFVLFLGAILYKEKLTPISVVSLAICFIGTLLISGVSAGTSMNDLLSSGVVWGLLAALFYAFTTLAGKGIRELSPYATTFLQTLVGIFMLMPLVTFHSFFELSAINWMVVAITGIVHTGIVYLLFFDSLRFLSSNVISVLVFLDPAVAILLDTLLTGFRPDILQSVGIVLIFGGMGLTMMKVKKKSDYSYREGESVK
ncbi:DMT family transporter [Priestia flexa]|uniref:DMT family transporter n=1 Tax=Priestia flexa TaxID=86664 RepID=UPI001B337D82|nr:DMT family transporter [Priestia flexa]